MLAILAILSLVGAVSAQASTPCGTPLVQPIQNRIVGGVVATPGSWPWMTLLVDGLGFISGSGVIIGSHTVLTTAQHFEGHGYTLFDIDLRHWRVYAGKYNISTTDPHEQYYHVKRVVLHPGYNTTSLENDLALIITTTPIAYNEHTRPSCIPDASHQYTVGNTCYLPGWGHTAHTGDEEVLNQVDLPIRDDSVCSQLYKDYLPNTELCAGYSDQNKGPCFNDLGSPLMCKDGNGAWYAQGLASSGSDCRTNIKPDVYEDLSMYYAWIKQTLEQAGYPYEY